MEKLLKQVLRKITPSEKEHHLEKEIIEKIFQELKKFREVEPLLVGSLAKRTDISTNKDIDIFIKFHPDVPRAELEKKGLKIAQTTFDKLKASYEIDYAEHPYVVGNYRGYTIEIVPCYDVQGKCKSAVDRTPFHTTYIQGKLSAQEDLRKEIRLLKQFMRGVGVYGAEAKIQGFSGYLTELLIITAGSFLNLLKQAQEWRFPHVLDPEKNWKQEDKSALPYLFPGANLIVIDPVDKNRNVAAAVSEERLSRFVVSARKFIASPQIEFFFPLPKKPLSRNKLLERISSRQTRIVALFFTHPKINPNILYSQLRKTRKTIVQLVLEKEFKILKSAEWSNEVDKSALLFELGVWQLPELECWLGPPIDIPQLEQEKFLHKYPAAYLRGNRWIAERKRKFKTPQPLIKKIIKSKSGFGKNLKQVPVQLLSGEELLKVLASEKDFLIFLGEFLKPL